MALTERMQQSQGSVQYFRRIADVQRARLWGVGGVRSCSVARIELEKRN